MKEIVIVSGKGGTGKTTVLARYAEIANNAVVADCDVDAPNLHMLLNPRIAHREAFVGSKMGVVDPDKCTNCGKCESLCRFDAISTIEVDGRKRVDIDIDRCEGCGVCARVCPEDAIDLRDRIVGEWFISDTNYGTMIHALLEPGAENSGKLVAMVKHKAKKTAKDNGAELVLVDGPPGIGCPVIAALAGANIVVIVSEPTVSGLSDFRRVADLAGGFKIKCALLVNKADLNHEMTASLLEEAAKREMPFIGRVPYDEGLMAAMAKGADAAAEYQGCPAIIEISKTYDALLGLL